MSVSLQEELVGLLGEANFLLLAEELGGQRLYIQSTKLNERVLVVIGTDATQILHRHFENAVLEVPLARETIARHYRDAGETDGEIAARLKITLRAVRKLFKRKQSVRRKRTDERQSDLFG